MFVQNAVGKPTGQRGRQHWTKAQKQELALDEGPGEQALGEGPKNTVLNRCPGEEDSLFDGNIRGNSNRINFTQISFQFYFAKVVKL